MVQAMDNSSIRPTYNAVNINIKKPEINTAKENVTNTIVNDNGIYNAVNIEIDNPKITSETKKVYDYPESNEMVTYDMIQPNQIDLPKGFYAYHTTNVIVPDNYDYEVEAEEIPEVEYVQIPDEAPIAEEIEIEEYVEPEVAEADEEIEVPAPNYTTVEAEKSDLNIENAEDEIEVETAEVEQKRPVIVPGEEIKPDVDVLDVVSNLTNPDYDVQAKQMEEIARISLNDSADAVPYIVRDIFSALIDITKTDSTALEAPSGEQIEARKKVIANFIAAQTSKANNPNAPVKLPFDVTEQDLALADTISPMEQAERNKEYALYTIAILSRVYSQEVEKQTGDIVPITDLPGTSAIVDSLRYSQNPGVRVAAIDALSHISRPEYKEELNTLFTLAQADANPEVAFAASRALDTNN